ncbi:putative transporter svop-1 [Dysidea avara]|uniref:putative transporter svop-1 n=1 Tax=Dysidea avara TaxID=196820 RepID=UPI0033187A75
MSNVVSWSRTDDGDDGVILTSLTPLTSPDEDEIEGASSTRSSDAPHDTIKNIKDDELTEVFTIEEAVDKIGFGVFQVLLSLYIGATGVLEAIEVYVLAFLSAVLKCQWNLNYAEQATITMVVFVGYLIGSPIWGIIADKFGRKKVILALLTVAFLSGLASAFSPNLYVLLLFRGGVGFAVGGAFVGAAYYSEFLPVRTRAVMLCLIFVSFAIGAVLVNILALVVMTSIHGDNAWRWLLGFTAIPLLVMILLFPLIPESPRYLVFHGKEEKAKKVLALIAKINRKPVPIGRLVTAEEKEQLLKERALSLKDVTEMDDEETEAKEAVNGTLPNIDNNDLAIISSDNESDSELLLDEHTHRRKQIINKLVNYYHWILILFKNGWWRTTLLLWFLWFAANLVHYGGVLLATSLFQHNQHCGLDLNANSTVCRTLTKSDYIHILWTSTAELPATVWSIVILLIMGRKKSIAVTTTAIAVCYALLFICSNKTVLTVFLFGVRGFATSFFQAIYLYTPEVYPTAVRAFGMSLCAGISRFGAMLTPFISQTLLAYNSIATISLFIVFSLLSSLASLLLPIETRGRPMKDTGG